MPTEVAPAAPAASTPAPASSPAPAAAPSAAPASAAPQATPAATPAAAPTFGGGSGVKSSVDPAQFRTTDDYAKAVLAEQLAAGTATEEPAAVAEPEVVAEPEIAPEVEGSGTRCSRGGAKAGRGCRGRLSTRT